MAENPAVPTETGPEAEDAPKRNLAKSASASISFHSGCFHSTSLSFERCFSAAKSETKWRRLNSTRSKSSSWAHPHGPRPTRSDILFEDARQRVSSRFDPSFLIRSRSLSRPPGRFFSSKDLKSASVFVKFNFQLLTKGRGCANSAHKQQMSS